MNSWRAGVQVWPTLVRKPIAASHSSGVRLTSRAKSCMWRTRLAMTCFSRGSGVPLICSRTASVTLEVVRSRIVILPFVVCLPVRWALQIGDLGCRWAARHPGSGRNPAENPGGSGLPPAPRRQCSVRAAASRRARYRSNRISIEEFCQASLHVPTNWPRPANGKPDAGHPTKPFCRTDETVLKQSSVINRSIGTKVRHYD